MSIPNSKNRRIFSIRSLFSPLTNDLSIPKGFSPRGHFGMMFRSMSFFLVFFALMLSTGCQPLTATIPPTPQIIHVQLTPALNSWSSILNACALALPGTGLVVDEAPASNLNPATVDFSLRFGLPAVSPQKTPVTNSPLILATDEVAVIVNPDNPVNQLAPETITAIFNGQISQWKPLIPGNQNPQPTDTSIDIQVWSFPQGDDIRQVFIAAFLKSNSLASKTHLAPDPNAMLEAISQDPTAIGYILASQLQASVQAVKIDGEPSSSLEQPVLAYTSNAPQGQVRQMLLCLQEKKSSK